MCRLFTFFSRLAQAYVWTKTKAFYQSCTLRFLVSIMKIESLSITYNLTLLLLHFSQFSLRSLSARFKIIKIFIQK